MPMSPITNKKDKQISYPAKDIKNRRQQHTFSFITPDHRPNLMAENTSPNADLFSSSHDQKPPADDNFRSQIDKQLQDESIDSSKISHEFKNDRMTLNNSDEENEPSDDEAFDITYKDDNKLTQPAQSSDAEAAATPKVVTSYEDTKQPDVVTNTDRSSLDRPGAHAIQGISPEQPRRDVSLTNITTAYVVDDDDNNSEKLRLEEENKRLKQVLEETQQQPSQLEDIPSAIVLPKRKIWNSRIGIILLIVVIISIGAVLVGVLLNKEPEEKRATSEPPSISLQPTLVPTISSKPSSSAIPTLSPSKTNAPTSDPTMTAKPTMTHLPTDPRTTSPTSFERTVLTASTSQQFLQTYRGVELMEMNRRQKEYFENAISTYTQHFAPKDDDYLIRTECFINEQVIIPTPANLFDGSNPVLLMIYYTVVYTSNEINVTEASYPNLFENYMNSAEGKLRTMFNLQSQKVAVDDVDDVIIKEYTSLSPTRVPLEDVSNQPTVLNTMLGSSFPTKGIGRGTNQPTAATTNVVTPPVAAPIQRPTNVPTFTAPESVSQRFFQRYEGPDLELMTRSQIDYFQTILMDYTPIFASDTQKEFIQTSCVFESQALFIPRRRLGAQFIRGMQVESLPTFGLDVEFTMTYVSNRINVTEAEYPTQFKEYMNLEEGNIRTMFNLQSVGMQIERINNVLILNNYVRA